MNKKQKPAIGTFLFRLRRQHIIGAFGAALFVILFALATTTFAELVDFSMQGEDEVNVHCEGRKLYVERLSRTDVRLTCRPDRQAEPTPTPVVNPIPTATPVADCGGSLTPVGALPNQPPPVFCLITNGGSGTETAVKNGWDDNFDHGLSFADFEGTNYRLFDSVGGIGRSIHWRHADHWMVDLMPRSADTPAGWATVGGALLSPNQPFQFENGKLTVGATVAAGINSYQQQAWPELVVSTSAAPTEYRRDGLYAYDTFLGHWTLGCRLHSTRETICSLVTPDGQRAWEMSAFQHVGTEIFGGGPYNGLEAYWRLCGDADPDGVCRDDFRLELTETSLTLYVNGGKYFEQSGIPPLPAEFVNGEVYVYYGSMTAGHSAETIRYHWDRLSVNSHR